MASVSSQSPFFHSLNSTNNAFSSSSSSSSRPTPRKNLTFFKTLKATSSSSPNSDQGSSSNEQKLDPVKLAFEKAKAYKKLARLGPDPVVNIVQNPVLKSDGGLGSVKDNNASGFVAGLNNESPILEAKNGAKQEVPTGDVKKKGLVGNDRSVEKSYNISGPQDQNQKNTGNSLLSDKIASKKEKLTVSSLDFVGLGFADKKTSRGLPPGLVPISEPFQDGDLPEVEILVGDTSRFANNPETKPSLVDEDESETYKPTVSTWGVFPRPSNISKTYGGGRVIQPGEKLETEENKAAKQKRTREMIAAYRKKTGLVIDPKLKLECQKTLEEGDSLMDLGKLKEALPLYQDIMDKLPFQSELHGLAAIQWSICQDSLSRSNEARDMYDKLQSHPTVGVRKRAKQFMFGFEAMEMMKVKNTSASSTDTGYKNLFQAFVEKKENYSLKGAEIEEQGEGALSQAIPYIFFLVSPIFLVILIAIRKGV